MDTDSFRKGGCDDCDPPPLPNWKVLIVDDEPDVHRLTRMVLEDVRFDDRGLDLLEATSAAGAFALLERHPDIAVVVLDVVMEHEHAGLDLIRQIREELGNLDIQILLRTGQPGEAPEEDVIFGYGINDYQCKGELTSRRFVTSVVLALRSYRQAAAVRQLNRRLREELDEKLVIEERLAAMNLQLENRVRERTRQLETANRELEDAIDGLREMAQRAEAASRAKSAFLANMSHEIRTPMNGIMGMADTMAETPLSEDQREMLDVVRTSSASLLGILDDILDYSSIEAGRIRIENRRFDIRNLVASVGELMASRAVEKKLRLVVEKDPALPHTAVGDPDRIRQVVVNLVGNAVKFTAEGEVVIRVTRGRSLDGGAVEVLFSVTDTGIGIETDWQEKIFEVFSQADPSSTRRHGGTGLGLAICRELAGKMGGVLHLASRVGEGSTFTLGVPLGAPASPPPFPEVWRTLLAGKTFGVDLVSETEGALVRGWLGRSGATPVPALGDWDLRVSERPFSAKGSGILVEGPDGEAGGVHLSRPVSMLRFFRAIEGLFETPCEKKAVLSPAPSKVQETRSRVLVVEDNAVNRRVASRILERRGFAVETARDGVDALERLARGIFEAVLMDVQMPVLDGLEVTRRLRSGMAGDGNRRTPVVALTASAAATDRDACLAAGMDDHVAKPVRPDSLVATLERVIGKNAQNGTKD